MLIFNMQTIVKLNVLEGIVVMETVFKILKFRIYIAKWTYKCLKNSLQIMAVYLILYKYRIRAVLQIVLQH